MNSTKQNLLDSAIHVIARGGWPALSVRSVAAEAKVSPSHIQYYFHTKAELIAGTYERVGDLLVADIAAFLEDSNSPERLLRILESWIPDTPDREMRARTWAAFTAASLHEGALAESARETDDKLRSWLSDQVRSITAAPGTPESLDAELTARQLLGMLDGLTLQALLLPITERRDFMRPALIGGMTALGL
ncbi:MULTISPECIES: TetR/AcrR family transcriptional regulator [Kocuria]|uniref:TetR/AcrR family transcriptional regulator n=1 Tax=Kocuria TaxID=57493 RepID=UPI0009E71ACE|nr:MULTISPECIES: TetR family transcriptional regulator C-terminal domain-containing protein [Kocuria]